MDQIKERCIYCGSDVYYTGTETLIKCGMCGHILVVAKFENELARMNQAIEEGEQAKKDLAEAEKARQDAQVRLQNTLENLDEIKGGQDVLSLLIQSVMAEQDTAEGKLTQVQDITDRILKGQGDLFEGMNILGEIKDKLREIGLNEQAQKDFAKDFVNWFQDIHTDDVDRLEQLQDQTSSILAEQNEISDKIDSLHQVAEETKEKIDEFENRYTQDKLGELRQLYRQAQNYQFDRAYDKAYDKYEQIVIKGGGDAAVLWHMILCHYCVSYQENDEGEMIPIIMNPDLTDPDEMSLRLDLENILNDRSMVTDEQAEIYRHELNKIDSILDEYRNVKHQGNYDIFISVKQDEDGHFTYDSDVAGELYHFLTSKGYKVFNSRISKIPAGEEYEPYIISALLSAKVMIVVGTCAENMNAAWVKNEWSRFQWIQQSEKRSKGETNRRLLCYLAKGMQPKDIPRGLNPNRQAIVEGVGSGEIVSETLEEVFRQRIKNEPFKAEKTSSASKKDIEIRQQDRNKDLPGHRFKYSKPMIGAGVVGLIFLCSLGFWKLNGTGKKAPEDAGTRESDSVEMTETDSILGYDLNDYVTLGKYKGLTYKDVAPETVSDQEVDEQINLWLASDSNARQITDRSAENGDTVVIDFEGKINGKSFEGGSAENYELKLGSGNFIDGFEDGLVGMYPGEEISLDLTYPDDYANEDLRGEQVAFEVTLHYIIETVDDMTDEEAAVFASAHNIDKTSTREELYENVRDWLETKNSYEVKLQIYEDLLSSAVDNATIKECPEELLGYYKDLYVGQYEYVAGMYGMDLDGFLEAYGMTKEDLDNKYQGDAEKTLVAGAIAEEEEIVIDDTVYDEELRKLANLQDTSVEELEQSYGEENLKYYFLWNLVGEFLLNNAIAE